MHIVPDRDVLSHKTGELTGLTVAQVNKILGFKPNISDDPSKVKHSWGFRAGHNNNELVECAVWDYYGFQFSCYGDPEVMREIFGTHYRRLW